MYIIKYYKDRNVRGNNFKRLEKLDTETEFHRTLMYTVTAKEILERSSIKDLWSGIYNEADRNIDAYCFSCIYSTKTNKGPYR